MNYKCLMTIVWPQKRGVELYYLYSFFKFQIYNIYKYVIYIYQSVQFSRSVMSDSLQPHELQHARSPYHQLPEFTQTHVHRVGDVIQPLILCCSLFLLPSVFSNIRVFSNESALRIRWPKYWSFSFNISPSNGHPGLISFRMDWFRMDLLAVQGTLKSLLQHHSSKASLLQCSAFFTVQLSHPYMTTGKTIALTRQTFVDKVMSLLMIFWMRNLGRTRLYGLFPIQWHQLGHLLENSLWKWFYYLHVWCLCTFWPLYLLVSLHIVSLLGSFHMMWTSYSMASQSDQTSNMTVYLPQSEHHHEKLQGSLWPSFSSPRLLPSSHSTG